MGYTTDIIFGLVFLIYPGLLLMASKGLENQGFSKDMTRKFVHAGTGLVIIFIPLFQHLWIALIPPILFTIINFIDYKFGWLSQIQGEDKGNVGTVLYPISFIILILVFFDKPYWGLAVLGILTMAFGDAGASLLGRKFGKTIYTVNDEKRSVVGSAAMFVLTYIVALIIFRIYGSQMGMTMGTLSLFSASFIIAGIATVIEALSIKGSDNITVPVLTALAGWLLITVFLHNVLGNQSIVQQPLF